MVEHRHKGEESKPLVILVVNRGGTVAVGVNLARDPHTLIHGHTHLLGE